MNTRRRSVLYTDSQSGYHFLFLVVAVAKVTDSDGCSVAETDRITFPLAAAVQKVV